MNFANSSNLTTVSGATTSVAAFGTRKSNAMRIADEIPVYDVWTIQSNEAGNVVLPAFIDFFQIPLNRIGSGFARAKTHCETNLSNAGQLPYGEPFTLRKLAWQVHVAGAGSSYIQVGAGAVASAVRNFIRAICEDATIEVFQGDNKSRGQYPTIRIGGLGHYNVEFGNANNLLIFNGGQGRRDVYKLDTPIAFATNEKFKVRMTFNPNNPYLAGNVPDADITGGAIVHNDYFITMYMIGTKGDIAR